MLKSFREKLVAVKKDVAASLKSVSDGLASKQGSTPLNNSSSLASLDEASTVNDIQASNTDEKEHSDAVQDLLHRYEETWEELYTNTQNNLKNSRAVVKEFHSVQNTASIIVAKVNEFEAEVKQLPTVLSTIQTITDQIVDLHSQCALIENSLSILNNLCEEAELEKAKQVEFHRLNGYEFQKKKELEAYSATLANEHRKKVIASELREAEIRREKELFYQKAFEEDMHRFRMEQTQRQTTSSLAEVTLQANKEDIDNLENFLNDGEGPSHKPVEQSPANSGEPAVDMRDESAQVKEGSDTDQSNRHSDVSSDGLEWDENSDTINMLEDSLEKEINDIVAHGSGLSLSSSAESDGTVVNNNGNEQSAVDAIEQDGGDASEQSIVDTNHGSALEQPIS